MAESTRRSSRRREKIAYAVGDIVEFTHNADLVTGRLLSKVEVDPGVSANATAARPRWRVVLQKNDSVANPQPNNSKDGEAIVVAESDLGALVTPSPAPPTTEESPRSATSSPTSSSRRGSNNNSKKGSSNRRITATTPNPEQVAPEPFGRGADSPMSTTSSGRGSPRNDDPDDPKKAASAMSREERSKRRQAMIDEDGTGSGLNNNGNTSNTNSKQRPLPPLKKKKLKHPGEDVVRVQLLTGTLYLYRGIHRRAEFVRKV